MSEHPSQSPGELIEAYLDEQISGPAKDRFEASLSQRPELRDQLERYRLQQEAIDASLRRMFAAPATPADAILEKLRAGHGRASDNGRHPADSIKLLQPPPHVRRSLLIAASIALIVCGQVIT